MLWHFIDSKCVRMLSTSVSQSKIPSDTIEAGIALENDDSSWCFIPCLPSLGAVSLKKANEAYICGENERSQHKK